MKKKQQGAGMHATKRHVLHKKITALALLLALAGVSLLSMKTVSRAEGETGTIYLPPDIQEWYADYDQSDRYRYDDIAVHFCSYVIILENKNADLRDYLLPEADREKAVISDDWPSNHFSSSIDYNWSSGGSGGGTLKTWECSTFSSDGHSARLKVRVPNRRDPQKLDLDAYLSAYANAFLLENIPYGTSYTVASTVVPDTDIVSKENDTGIINAANPEAHPAFSYPATLEAEPLDGGVLPYELYKRLAVGKDGEGNWQYEDADADACKFVVYSENPEYLSEEQRAAGRSADGMFQWGYSLWGDTNDRGTYYSFAGVDGANISGYSWMIEETAPDGYAPMQDPFVFVTDINGEILRWKENDDVNVYTYTGGVRETVNYCTAVNYKAAALTVTKTDGEDDSLHLAGAEFALYHQNPASGSSLAPVDIQTTGADGTAVFRGLAASKTYYLKETAAPDGYEVSD